MVSRRPRHLPHWSLLGLLFWLFLIFLIWEYSRNVSLDLFSSLSTLILLVISCSPVVLNNIHTLTTSQWHFQLSLCWISDSHNLTSYLTSPNGHTGDISRLSCPKRTPTISPKICSAEFPIAVKGNSVLLAYQVKRFESLSWVPSFSHTLHSIHRTISVKYLQNPITSHHTYCHHPGLSHYSLLGVWLRKPSIWSPCF